MSYEKLRETVEKRYFAPGETSFDDVCMRVAKFLLPDDWKSAYTLMRNRMFLPNTPCLMNAGTKNPQMSACFVLPIEDDMSKIFETLHNTAMIHKSGGGTGFTFSHLRPEGDVVSGTGGVASGPVSFMKVYDAATDAVKQGGKRRGANMGILNFQHKDIDKFITCKKVEGTLSNFNISVMMTDDDMREPDSKMHPCGKTYGELRRLLVDGIYLNGEPGVLFQDTIDSTHQIEATNPCLALDQRVLTSGAGYKPLSELIGLQCAFTSRQYATPVITQESIQCIRVGLNNGRSITCTYDHVFYLKNGHGVWASDLKPGDELKTIFPEISSGSRLLPNAYEQGFHSGDGTVDRGVPYIWIYNEEKARCFGYEWTGKAIKHKIDVKLDKSYVPTGDIVLDDRLRWLAGLIDSDGSLESGNVISISSIDKDFLIRVAELCDTLGIISKVRLAKSECSTKNIKGKDYTCKALWRIRFHSPVKIPTRRVIFDISGNYRNGVRVESIDYLDDRRPVACYNIASHTVFTAGVTISNCGEVPLLPYESCNLGSFDLSKYVTKGRFDWVGFKRDIGTAKKILEAVLEKNAYPLEAIREASQKSGKIGCGIMGFYDACVLQGIPYDISTNFLTNVMSTLKDTLGRDQPSTCIAPTGSLSILASCSSGIEPVFQWAYKRNGTTGISETIEHPLLHRLLAEDMITQDEYDSALETGKLPPYDTALDISPEVHIKVQAAAQQYCDLSVSKTVNMREDYPKEKIWDLIKTAWASGCKGLTMYRNNSREVTTLETVNSKKSNVRPKELKGKTAKLESGCCDLYVTANGDPVTEVFIMTTGHGGCSANLNAIGRLISIALQSGVPMDRLVRTLNKVRCPACKHGKSCAAIIGNYISTPTTIKTVYDAEWIMRCPECGEPLTTEGGCEVCKYCGYTLCQ